MSRYRDELSNKTLIAAHRGTAGGNIPCNTYAAFQAALQQGADIIELDISLSADGTQYVFHPGMEPAYIGGNRLIRDMRDDEVRELYVLNPDNTRTEEHIPLFSECLDFLKGRCRINVDKFWTDIPGIASTIRAHGMQDQVIVKVPLNKESLCLIEEYASDIPFMPILQKDDGTHEQLVANKRLRYIGSEVIFASDTEPLASSEVINRFHRDGCVLWVNSIIYDYRVVLSGNHTDDRSICGDPDNGWGWLIERGFDIIQTDWPLALRLYGEAKYPELFSH